MLITDAQAWKWLMSLECLDKGRFKPHEIDQQVMIRAYPADDPNEVLIHVSIKYPGVKGRLKGSGDTLGMAVEMVYGELKREGIEFMHPNEVIDETE